MSIKNLYISKQISLGMGLILAAPLLLAELGHAVPLNRSARMPLSSQSLVEPFSFDEAGLGVESQLQTVVPLQVAAEGSSSPAGAPSRGQSTANMAGTANFVPQNVLDVVNQLGSAAIPTLPGLGHADKFIPAQDAFAPLRLLLKLSERRVYIYQREQVKTSFPVAVGRQGWETPTGRYTVIQMQHDPVWQHPFTGELVPPGRDNPLGARWIGFWTDGTNYIGFHGTPNEETVGQPASHGCVRMYNQDVIQLFEMVRLGTTVEVVP